MKARTRTRSLLMRFIISENLRRLRHRRAALRRKLRRESPTVHYFHQVDDPYSHLAVQKLDALREAHKVEFVPHLVSCPPPEYLGDNDRFHAWAVRDARGVAPHYGVELPTSVDTIDPAPASKAASQLASLLAKEPSGAGFAGLATQLGNALWRGEDIPGDSTDPESALAAGDHLRAELGHYLGAMFYFEGEWYWGLDRLCHLEARLADAGMGGNPVVPRPTAETTTGADDITLEFFVSLRSPYTAASFDRTVELARRTGAKLVLRPVLPMMMRGIPAPRPKQFYIMRDATREADMASVPFGNIVDPFGEPIKRAYSLLPYMQIAGKDVDYCGAYLCAAWSEGIDITSDMGIRKVVERIGIDWADAKSHLDAPGWEPLLDANLQDMLNAGLWGVPSYRVTGGAAPEPFVCWGQDRLWRVETEIARRNA